MCEIAGEVADGILVMPFNSERHFRERTLPAIEKGLATGRRDRSGFEVIAEVIVGMGRGDAELDAAARGVRGLLSFYGSTPSYRPVLEVEGWADRQPVLNEMSKRGEWKAMADVIDEQMLRTLAVFGTAEECAGQIVERFGADATRVCCYFPGYPATDERIAELVTAIKKA
jgi:probable F420-dependent oxidoreductase